MQCYWLDGLLSWQLCIWLAATALMVGRAFSPPLHAVLKLAPRDGDALRCKAVLLIEAGRLDEALKLLGEPPLAPGMAFEKVRTI